VLAVFRIQWDAEFFALADLEPGAECIPDQDFDPDLK
jgi:hypothetical protein